MPSAEYICMFPSIIWEHSCDSSDVQIQVHLQHGKYLKDNQAALRKFGSD